MEQAVVEGELVGDVELEVDRAVDRAADGEEQMMLLAQVDNRPDVEGRADVGKIRLVDGLVENLDAQQNVGGDLLLQDGTEEALPEHFYPLE
jgi:hypothetical protein